MRVYIWGILELLLSIKNTATLIITLNLNMPQLTYIINLFPINAMSPLANVSPHDK